MKKFVTMLMMVVLTLTVIPTFNVEAAAKQKLTVKEATENIAYETVETPQGLVVIFQNGNTKNIILKATVSFYDAENNKLSAKSDVIDAFQAKTKSVLTFSYPRDKDYNLVDYNNFKIKMKITLNSDSYFKSCYKDITIDSNQGSENVIADVTNNSKENCDISLTALYYFDGKIIGFDEQDVPFLDAWDTESVNFENPCDADYRDVDYDNYEIVLNHAFEN